MREIRQSGSEGGVAQSNALLLPLSYEVNFVDLCEQPCPGGAGLLGRHGLIQGVLGGCAEAQGRLLLVVLLPALWSQAGKVGPAGPCATGT